MGKNVEINTGGCSCVTLAIGILLIAYAGWWGLKLIEANKEPCTPCVEIEESSQPLR